MYGVLEYKNGRWKQPMALRIELRHERAGTRAASLHQRNGSGGGADGESVSESIGGGQIQTASFVASSYPEEGWAYLVDSVESLELIVDPNFD